MRSTLVVATGLVLSMFRAASAQSACGVPQFGSEHLLAGESVYARSVFAADLDGDGDDDILSASAKDAKLAWYETGAGGVIGPQRVITSELAGATSVRAADLDGDGDLDVMGASQDADTITWFENLDGHGSFGLRQPITKLANGVSSIGAADLDGDGDLDVLSSNWNDHKLTWYENRTGVGDFTGQQLITSTAHYANEAMAADLDGDGDADVLWCGAGDDEVAWFENDGQGSFPQNHAITLLADGASSVFAADIDGDGDADVLSASDADDKVAWYENTDALGSFGPQQVITTLADGTRSVCTADLNGDGSLDVAAASPFDDTVAWYANADGRGAFGGEQLITTSVVAAHDVGAADLDGDGDLDALSASSGDHKIAWYENLDGAGSFGVQRVVTTAIEFARRVVPADIDGDGYIDLASTSFGDRKLAWYRNLDGLGSFGPQQVITNDAYPAQFAVFADLDGDGDLDAMTSCSPSTKLAWFENLDGKGAFGPPIFLTGVMQYVTVGAPTDMDADGDLDLVVVAFNYPSGTLEWLENSGAGAFAVAHVVASSLAGGPLVRVADLDGDHDPDLLCATNNDDVIGWYENIDGHGAFGPQRLISTAADGPRDLDCADLDADGDLDVLSASWNDREIAWCENTDGLGSFGSERIIATSVYEATSVCSADLNGDGIADVMFSATGDSKAAWKATRPMIPALEWAGAPLESALGAPRLVGASCLESGSVLTLTLTNAAPGSPAFLVMGLSNLGAPLKGGVLIPYPDYVVLLMTDAQGASGLHLPLPLDLPSSVSVFFQFWIVDGSGPQGFSASNALMGTTH